MIKGNPDVYVGIDDINDGEAFLLTQVEYGEAQDQILMNREAAVMLIEELNEMLGIELID